jgi:hypothetical protein
MAAPTDANVNPDQPNYNTPLVETKPWMFATGWQKFISILMKALRVIDGGTP